MMRKSSLWMGLLLCCFVLLPVCAGADKPEPDQAAKMAAADSTADSGKSPAGKENEMVAKVNGETINRAELDGEIQNMMTQLRDSVPPEQMASVRPMVEKRALGNLINRKLLMQTAVKEKITADPAAVDKEYSNFESQFPSPEVLKQQMSTWGVTEEKIRTDIAESLKINTLLEKQTKDIPPLTNEEVEKFYADNPDNFKTPERVEASHILITAAESDPPEIRAEKRLRLAGIQGQLAKGADFAELAKKNSDCPSKENGGQLGFFERGQMVKPFEDAAFAMKPGEVSDIVETQFGYHLIKTTNHEDAKVIPLEEAKPRITEYLLQQKQGEVIKAYLDTLQGSASIEYAEGITP